MLPRKGNSLLSLPPALSLFLKERANPTEDGISGTEVELCGAIFRARNTSVTPEQERKVCVTEFWISLLLWL